MKFHRQATVGLLDVGLGRVARQLEHFVVVALRHCADPQHANAGDPTLTRRPFITQDIVRSSATLLPSFVLHFFELGIDARRPCRRRAGAASAAAAAPARAAHPRRPAARRPAARSLPDACVERLGLLLDGVLVVALERVSQHPTSADSTLARSSAVDLVAEILERLLVGVHQTIGPVARRRPARGTSCPLRRAPRRRSPCA